MNVTVTVTEECISGCLSDDARRAISIAIPVVAIAVFLILCALDAFKYCRCRCYRCCEVETTTSGPSPAAFNDLQHQNQDGAPILLVTRSQHVPDSQPLYYGPPLAIARAVPVREEFYTVVKT